MDNDNDFNKVSPNQMSNPVPMKARVASFRKGMISQSELVNVSDHKKNMPPDFLRCPSFRLNIHQIVDNFMEYSVVFNLRSQEERIGLTIATNPRSGDIYVSGVQGKNYNSHLTSLALSSGIRQYDVLIGINSQLFSPGVEEQDVRDIIEGSQKYITLHFVRGAPSRSATTSRTLSSLSPRLGRESVIDNLRVSLSTPPSSGRASIESPVVITPIDHPCTRIFIDQGLITAESARNNTIAISRLKQRVLTWDDNVVNRPAHTLSSREQYASSPNKEEKKDEKRAGGGGVLSPLFSPSSPSTFDKSSTLLRRASEKLRPSSIRASLQNILTGSRASSLDSQAGSYSEANTLRPALSTHILNTQQVDDYTVYTIWVMDVRTGCEWEVVRRYREFNRFREVNKFDQYDYKHLTIHN